MTKTIDRPPTPVEFLIEIFTAPDCPRCASVMTMVENVVANCDGRIGVRLVDVLEEIDYAVALGVLMTPAIVFNGKLVISGPPSKRHFRSQLVSFLARGR